ncbi:MAG: ABC transporter ATP-binding protein [Anaerolineae bacterium]|nr:ABC transporter ATP-binding protein [Anaerolineae bacterium]
MSDTLITATRLSKSYLQNGRVVKALANVSFDVHDGEFVALVGPSGCGKSTLLRLVGGLLAPDEGEVLMNGAPVTGPRTEIGFVFQAANLMPWRTVLDNIALPLDVLGAAATGVAASGMTRADARREARRLSDLVGLQGFEQAYPRQLSGGMQQRVVLARALIHRPRLLLLDEPFGALDALTRERMNFELLRVWQLRQATVILVTHSIAEAVLLADRVMVMGPRPGHVTATIPIPLPRPRSADLLSTEHFGRLALAVRRAIDQAGQPWPGPPIQTLSA